MKNQKSLTPARYEQKIRELLTYLHDLEIECEKLKGGLDHSDQTLVKAIAETELLTKQLATSLKEKMELEARLKWTEDRLTEALSTAHSTALAAGAISTLTNNLSDLYDTIKAKLDQVNNFSPRWQPPPRG